ncbi:hypothetical protein BHU72_10060 [Desulfuribacillus stibiiarsenatis]|uniref:TVP38/TMEM64 family membrane protein n=1 Tax=Desulfuribacillus stibiiarsenatis TaxID=1390249 RepID=A0A1E5L8Z6_9FIRM|nr:VTT domain-containing protein [Desulfuribacillus stibiiarsenatis]OEH86596.1 hypothetical protein BHU72_10060 [Desulfuribacillus stibiiarsenatis]
MTEQLLDLLHEYRSWAMVISIMLGVVIAIMGVLPSYFLTAANLVFFGFWTGTLISFIGEVLGAILAFILYRMGFRNFLQKQLEKYPKAQRLINAEGKDAFMLVLTLRLLPFMPSGLVTFGGAIGKISLLSFAIASSIGKLPALLFEAFSVYQVTQFNWLGKVILFLALLYFVYLLFKSRNSI